MNIYYSTRPHLLGYKVKLVVFSSPQGERNWVGWSAIWVVLRSVVFRQESGDKYSCWFRDSSLASLSQNDTHAGEARNGRLHRGVRKAM